MTTLLRLIHILAVLGLGVSAVSTVGISAVLLGQFFGMISVPMTSVIDLVYCIVAFMVCYWYLWYIDDPDLVASYIKSKLRIKGDDE